MMVPDLKPGDYFCTFNPHQATIGKPIIWIQKWMSPDRSADYSHSGLIIDKHGRTFEAGIKEDGKIFHSIGCQNLFEVYEGSSVLIARHERMNKDLFEKTFTPIYKQFNNTIYPYWRLLLFLNLPIARRLGTKKFGVCSELVSLFFYKAGLFNFWMGVYPDMLADFAHNIYGRKAIKTIYKGLCAV